MQILFFDINSSYSLQKAWQLCHWPISNSDSSHQCKKRKV